MDYRLHRITPWIHTHAIASILGMLLVVFALDASNLFLSVGASSCLYVLGFILNNPTSILIDHICTPLLFALPLLLLLFYIFFLWKKYTIPYLIFTAIDTLIVLVWFIYALCVGNAWVFLPDTIVTTGMAVGMAVAYFRSPLA